MISFIFYLFLFFGGREEVGGISDTRLCIGNLIYDGKLNFFPPDACNAHGGKSRTGAQLSGSAAFHFSK